jgi:hypothetical protein
LHLEYQDEGNLLVDWDRTLRSAGHEAMHQFCFNSGLLNHRRDYPDCISEGLAVLAEFDPAKFPRLLDAGRPGRIEICAANRGRLAFPLTALIGENRLFHKADIISDVWEAYAQAWFLVYVLMTDPDLRPKFPAYLKAVVAREDASHRLEDVRTHLGDPLDLEARMIRRLKNLSDHPPSRYNSPRRVPRT